MYCAVLDFVVLIGKIRWYQSKVLYFFRVSLLSNIQHNSDN